MGNAKRDENYIPTLLAVSNADGTTPITLYADATTHRLLVSATPGALDDLTDVVITSPVNGQALIYSSGTWINGTATASISGSSTRVLFFDGDNTPAGDAGFTYAKATDVLTVGGVVVGTSHLVPASNDGAQLGISGTAFSDLFLASGGVINFNAGDVTLTHGSNVLTLGGGDLALGANSLTMTGTLAATGARVATGFFTNLDVTNTIVGTATNVVTNANLTGPITSVGNTTSVGSQTGTGTQFVMSASPTLVTPNIGSATATKINGLVITSTTGTLTLAAGKTLTVSNTLTFTGTDSITIAFGSNSITFNTTGTTTMGLATSGTASTLAGTEELTNKTLTSSVGKGTWTASGTWTLPAVTLGGLATISENVSLSLPTLLSADGKYAGITFAGTAGAALSFGDLVYFKTSTSTWFAANAGTSTTATNMLAMCVLAAAGSGSATTLMTYGKIRADANFPTLSIGAPAYVGTNDAKIAVAQPVGTDQIIRVVGWAITGDELFFSPSQDWITHI